MNKKSLKIVSCAAVAAVMTLSSGMALTASADWQSTSSGYVYTNESGKKVTGWKTIDGNKYYFNSKGIAATGFKTIKGKKYYFIKTKKGMMATGFYKIGGDKYYFGSDGVMRTGWKTISGKKYYFGTDGVMATGKVEINGKTYTFNSDGSLKSGSSSSSGLGSISIGMSRKKVIEAAKIDGKNYSNISIGNGISALYVPDQSFYGVEGCDMEYIFDEDNKLIGIAAVSMDGSGGSAWAKALKKDFNYTMEFTKSQVGMDMVIYYDDQNMMKGRLAFTTTQPSGIDMVIVTEVPYLTDLSNAMNSFTENYSSLLG